ncbi:hypothetical protein IF1G_11295 [Cordyceps javanica]|uniref:Uncharacterized protein n=1 Tax=Cordyceps javanica TaxID=43265 RepID=A0A545UKQ1_9HYPO|nr:hypothetical protein IF1G_11295 [Cordyceps javanica]
MAIGGINAGSAGHGSIQASLLPFWALSASETVCTSLAVLVDVPGKSTSSVNLRFCNSVNAAKLLHLWSSANPHWVYGKENELHAAIQYTNAPRRCRYRVPHVCLYEWDARNAAAFAS